MAACHEPGLRWGVSCGRAGCGMEDGGSAGGGAEGGGKDYWLAGGDAAVIGNGCESDTATVSVEYAPPGRFLP